MGDHLHTSQSGGLKSDDHRGGSTTKLATSVDTLPVEEMEGELQVHAPQLREVQLDHSPSIHNTICPSRKEQSPNLREKGQPVNGMVALHEEIKHAKWSSESSDASSNSGTDYQQFILVEQCEQIAKKRRILEKLVFTITIVTLILLTMAMVRFHWLLPYYYALSAPILIISRIIMYWKFKWQYYLIDFCYFGNSLIYIYLWAIPANLLVFSVMFGIANGPLAWAVAMFRNSLVFHSTDKMTSVFIHSLPMMLTYGIRWFPEKISTAWYTTFVTEFYDGAGEKFIWVMAVPFACFFFHSVMYMFLVYCIFRPSEDYMNSHRYISTRKIFSPCINMCGPNHDKMTYTFFNNLYVLISLLFTPLWFSYFTAHTIFICLVLLFIIWNGASFYMDVFAIKGHTDD